MIQDSVRPLKDYYQELQTAGAPDYLTRHLEARGADWAARLDEPTRERVVGQYIDHLGGRLAEHLRSPLVRSPERQAAVEQATREFLERLEREHPDLGLAATPQFVRQFAQVAGLGVLEPLLDDPEVTEIIVENHRSILIEKDGRTVPVPNLAFPSEEAWRRQAIALCTLSGRPVGVEQPLQSFFFSDGSRITVIIGPDVAHRGTLLNIRRKRATSYTLAALVEREALSAELARYLEGVVKAWGNVVVCGESGCGKTSLLEALVNAISPQDRAVLVQENDELNPTHPHLRYLLAATTAAQKGATLRDCTRFAMLIAPRRLIVGEVKEGEAADMLFAITAGFSGCMTTIHSYSGRDALDRLYIAALMDPTGRYGTGGEVLRRAIAGAVDVVVHVAFSPQGRRHVDQVHEVWGLDDAGRWDARPAWEAVYGETEEETISWQQPEGYILAPRLQEKLRVYRGRTAMEARDLPETPIERAARWQRAYREAVALGNAGLYERALASLREVQDENPAYRDVERLVADFRARKREQERRTAERLAGWRARALDAARRGDQDMATWIIGEVQELAPAAAERLRQEVASAYRPVGQKEAGA